MAMASQKVEKSGLCSAQIYHKVIRARMKTADARCVTVF
jgi:hypothetical protein